jgi:hypothetical protein
MHNFLVKNGHAYIIRISLGLALEDEHMHNEITAKSTEPTLVSWQSKNAINIFTGLVGQTTKY